MHRLVLNFCHNSRKCMSDRRILMTELAFDTIRSSLKLDHSPKMIDSRYNYTSYITVNIFLNHVIIRRAVKKLDSRHMLWSKIRNKFLIELYLRALDCLQNSEFQTYTPDSTNSYVSNGLLYIKPVRAVRHNHHHSHRQ